jgi:glycosyltransferase involved in cell wall biosynthesis
MTYSIGFLMEQVAGHVTHYRNMRDVIDQDTSLDVIPWWEELHYRRPEGRLETLHERYAPFMSTYLTGNARMMLEFRAALTRRSYDAIFTNSWATMFFPGALTRIPTIIGLDSTSVQIQRMPEYRSPRDPAPLASLKRHLWARAFGAAAVVQAWSSWAKRSAVRDYGIPESKVIVRPPGVDLQFFKPRLPREKTEPCRIVFVGGDFRRKGGHLLLEWFRHQSPSDVELHIATREHVDAAPGVVVHRGVGPQSAELLNLYRSADIFALPSLAECFGLATVEAMAVGLPVVVSDVGGTADIVDHGANGFIVRAGDGADLSRALSALLSDPGRRRTMGSRSRQLAEQRFDARTNSLLTLLLLRDLASGDYRDRGPGVRDAHPRVRRRAGGRQRTARWWDGATHDSDTDEEPTMEVVAAREDAHSSP